jgi:squalene-hopene/tetraprenyl-beta-curcumene cyclase
MTGRRAAALLALATVAIALGLTTMARSADTTGTAETLVTSMRRGTAYLVQAQAADGSWEHHVGITAVAVLALLEPAAHQQPGAAGAVGKGLGYLEQWGQPDGGIYQQDVKHYSTAVALLALAASRESRYAPRIAGARRYLMSLQARDENGFPPSHVLYGGTLVDEGKANLDATSFAMRALAAGGLAPDDPYWRRALQFVTRCQNWKPANDQPWAGDDGGFVFAPGFSFAGGTTSYGSMTYAGLSAYRDVGLSRTDERVAAGLRWVAHHFTTDENPGLQRQTLYHSYLYMSQTLPRWGVDTFVDDAGRVRAWRNELAATLGARQQADGSWANTEDPRWWESKPALATSFAVRALATIGADARSRE